MGRKHRAKAHPAVRNLPALTRLIAAERKDAHLSSSDWDDWDAERPRAASRSNFLDALLNSDASWA